MPLNAMNVTFFTEKNTSYPVYMFEILDVRVVHDPFSRDLNNFFFESSISWVPRYVQILDCVYPSLKVDSILVVLSNLVTLVAAARGLPRSSQMSRGSWRV